jgi:sulfhydrogenase subunit beta (sulfur reductase)
MPDVIDVAGLQVLLDQLHDRGYTVVAPTVRDGVVIHAAIASVADLPRGVGDSQQPGSYGIVHRDDELLFGYAACAQSWKPWLFPAEQLMWRARATSEGFAVDPAERQGPYAFVGVRSCDLHAIAIQDRVLAGRAVTDADYVAKRRDNVIIAVGCAVPGGTCFCASMGTGPTPEEGFDLALTELSEGGHRFVVRVGSDTGRELLAAVPSVAAEHPDAAEAASQEQSSIARMGRAMNPQGVKDLLYAAADSPRWEEIAQRCLACGNCTLVCPTCFCTSVEDVSVLDLTATEHVRVWDSCFSPDFSHVHGGSVRTSTSSRYRQWLTHKLAAWEDQFGTSGCVGCGRCVTWCPVGIDLTAEVAGFAAEAEQP